MANASTKDTSVNSRSPNIPLIDFVAWTTESLSDDVRKSVAHDLVRACHSSGFVYLTNHGISPEDLDVAFSWIKKFFDLPPDKKELAAHPEDSVSFRGWQKVGVEKANRYVDDIDESFAMGSDASPHDPNIWLPEEELPGFRAWALSFYDQCWKLSQQILKALALGLGLEEDHLLQHHSRDDHELSIRYYPPVPASRIDNKKAARLGTHSDFNSCTLLFQDDCGGLEAEKPDKPGEFVSVEPIPGALVMNIGDVLMRWSNDYLVSTRHRVLLPPLADRFTGPERTTRQRYSMPFFIVPKREMVIESIPGIVGGSGPGSPPKYKPITFKEFVDVRSKQTFGEGLGARERQAA